MLQQVIKLIISAHAISVAHTIAFGRQKEQGRCNIMFKLCRRYLKYIHSTCKLQQATLILNVSFTHTQNKKTINTAVVLKRRIKKKHKKNSFEHSTGRLLYISYPWGLQRLMNR